VAPELLTDILRMLLVAAAYYLTARLSLRLALVRRQVTPIWPPTGIALVALLLFGRRVWPGIAVAAVLVNAGIGPSFAAALGIGAGNTLAPVVASYLLDSVGFRRDLERLRDAVAIVVLAALFGMTISATGGTLTLLASGAIRAGRFWPTWWVWWAGDAMGVLVFAPFLLSLRSLRFRAGTPWRRQVEAGVLFVATAAVTLLVFRTPLRVEYLVLPFLGWAAWRFRQRGAAPAALLTCGIAAWAAVHGTGPFAGRSLFDRMVTLQVFNAGVALSSFVLAALVSERSATHRTLELASVDLEDRVGSRTGELSLANQLLEREIEERRRAEDRLGRTGKQLVEAQEIAHLGSWEWDIASNVVTWSDELYRIYGLERTDFPATYEGFLERVHPADRDLVDGAVQRAYGEGSTFGFDHRIIRPDGTERWVHGRGEVTVDATGNPIRMAGTAQDISERMLVQERLANSEEELRAYIDALSTFTAKVALDGSILMAGKTAQEASGLSLEEFMRTNFLEGAWWTFDPKVQARVTEAFGRAVAGELVNYDENLFVFGQVLTINFSLVPVVGDDHRVAYVLAEGRDITAQKKLEAKFQGLLEAAPDAMVGVDQAGLIRLVNRQAEVLFGYGREELLGRPIETLVPQRLREIHPLHREGYFAQPRTRAMGAGLRLAGQRKDGTEFPVDISLSSLETEEGVVVTAAVRDITERRQAEEDLRQSEAAFRLLAEAMERQTVTIQEQSALVQLLQDVTVAANEAPDIEEAVRGCLRAVCDHAGWSAGHAYLLAKDRPGVLVPTNVWHLEDPQRFAPLMEATARTHVETVVDLPGKALGSGHRIWVRDVTQGGQTSREDEARRAGVTAAFACPIMLGTEVAGVLEFFSGEAGWEPGGRLVEVMDQVAGRLGRVIERHRTEAALRASQQRTRSIIETANDAFVAIDRGGLIIEWNHQAEVTFGWPAQEILGRPLVETIIPHRYRKAHAAGFERYLATGGGSVLGQRIELSALARDGREFPVELTIWQIGEGDAASISAFVRDITATREADARLRHMAMHDTLTGLPNRALFLDRVAIALAQAGRHPSSRLAVMFLDLDNFKVINDSLGHEEGDRLLVWVAERLKSVLREGDTIARFGGDEFVFLCEITKEENALEIARRLGEAVAKPMVIHGQEVAVTASLGIAIPRSGRATPESLMRDADAAMYRAKAEGRDRFEVFDHAMRLRAVGRLKSQTALRRGIDQQEFFLVYQPEIRLDDGRMVALEALARWRHPDGRVVLPNRFIGVAEEMGLIVPLGALMLEQACGEAARWQALGGDPVTVAVNLSPHQLGRSGLVEMVASSLEGSGIEPSTLCLEITEGVLIGPSREIVAVLRGLKELGVSLAIDDFGTGYSSLGYLSRFPIDVVKVDRSFVSRLESDPQAPAIVSAVIGLAHSLGLVAIAEGVETRAQLEHLQSMGCDQAQGFLFARPEADPVGEGFFERTSWWPENGFAGDPSDRPVTVPATVPVTVPATAATTAGRQGRNRF